MSQGKMMRFFIVSIILFLALLSCEMPVDQKSNPDPLDVIPINLTAELAAKNEILLTWECNSDTVDEFIIERMITWNSTMITHSLDNNNFIQIGCTIQKTFSDSNLEIETLYAYRVKAKQTDKESDYSSKVWQETPCIGHLEFIEQCDLESIGGVSPADIAISPDGSSLYLVDTNQRRLVLLKRDPLFGILEYSASYSDEKFGIELL